MLAWLLFRSYVIIFTVTEKVACRFGIKLLDHHQEPLLVMDNGRWISFFMSPGDTSLGWREPDPAGFFVLGY